MNHIKKPLRILLAVVVATQLAACSKTVQWEEEVPLNAGETIWVKREVAYKLQGAGGNPLDMAYRPDWTEVISFEWHGKKYRYVGDAGLMLLAISPMTQHPVLVADAAYKDWDWRHGYHCTTPYYVQFMPSAEGDEWSWPPSMEPWLFNLPSNLMVHREEMSTKMKSRYTSSDREAMDKTMSIQSPRLARIISTYKFDQCFK